MSLELYNLRDKLKERIRLKNWSSDTSYNFYIVMVEKVEHLVVVVYNFEKWKQLILTTTFTNDQLINYFIDFISGEVSNLRGEKILFLYNNKIKTNYKIENINNNLDGSYGIFLTIK